VCSYLWNACLIHICSSQKLNLVVISQVKVPLSYAPKRKYLDRIREQEDLVNDTKVAIKLPRMSFEITNFAYDTSRQLTKTSTFNTTLVLI
jgi:hypothetical protein